MYREHSVGVVIPAYNEEGFVGRVIDEMPEYVDRMYVVDDYSTDGTWGEILEAAQHDRQHTERFEPLVGDSFDQVGADDGTSEPATDGGQVLLDRATQEETIGRVVPIKHDENRGAGGAVKTGYLAALADEMDITVTVDGDGQMDLTQMPKLLDPIVYGDADYAKGNRLLYRDYRTDMPKFRFIGNSILTFLTKISSGYWKTMDPQNGYTAISQYALENVAIETMHEYYGYCNHLLVKLNAKGMRIADVAIPAVYGDEESAISYPSYIWKVSGMLLESFMWRLKVKYLVLDFHPLALFYLFGAGMMLSGLVSGSWSIYGWLALENQLFIRAAVSLLLFSIGSMFVMFAMLFDMQVNQEREIQIRN